MQTTPESEKEGGDSDFLYKDFAFVYKCERDAMKEFALKAFPHLQQAGSVCLLASANLKHLPRAELLEIIMNLMDQLRLLRGFNATPVNEPDLRDPLDKLVIASADQLERAQTELAGDPAEENDTHTPGLVLKWAGFVHRASLEIRLAYESRWRKIEEIFYW